MIIILLIIGVPLAFLLGFALTGKLAGILRDRQDLRQHEERMAGFYPFLTADEFDQRNAEQASPAAGSTEVATQLVA